MGERPSLTGYTLRAITPDDAALVAVQRARMFAETAGHDAAEERQTWTDWLAEAIAEGQYFGFVVECQRQPVGGVGLLVQVRMPSVADPSRRRAHILNMYVDPEHRRQGLAEALLHAAIAEASRRGMRNTSLNAAPLGRRIYERLGFVETTDPEMRRVDSTP